MVGQDLIAILQYVLLLVFMVLALVLTNVTAKLDGLVQFAVLEFALNASMEFAERRKFVGAFMGMRAQVVISQSVTHPVCMANRQSQMSARVKLDGLALFVTCLIVLKDVDLDIASMVKSANAILVITLHITRATNAMRLIAKHIIPNALSATLTIAQNVIVSTSSQATCRHAILAKNYTSRFV